MLIKQLQAACEVELFSQAEIAEVVRHMDIERDGHITFLEFVHAFGIGDNDDARDDDEVDGIDGAGCGEDSHRHCPRGARCERGELRNRAQGVCVYHA